MGFLGTIQRSFKEYSDKKKEERDMMERLRLESKIQKQQIFEDEFKKNALEVAKSEAKKSAAEKSGLQKLRAMNRARRLTESGNSGSIFSKLSQYTQKNIAKREENMKRTNELREAGKKMREENLAEQRRLREERMVGRKPFGN